MARNANRDRDSVQKDVDELVDAHWLVLKEYRTIRGHAFYEYCIRSDRPFTDDEVAKIGRVVVLPDKASPETVAESAVIDQEPVELDAAPITPDDHESVSSVTTAPLARTPEQAPELCACGCGRTAEATFADGLRYCLGCRMNTPGVSRVATA